MLAVPGERSHKETLITQKKNVIIFGQSILKEINTRLLNKKLIKSKALCKCFPGATSKDFVHYIKPTLQENEFDTSILYMGVNDVLKLGSNIDTASKDIINIVNHCKNFGVKQIIISGLTLTTRLKASFIYQLNKSIKELCQKHGYSFIDNSNVSSENLQQDGLHLNNSGKGCKNYAVTLNDSYFLGPYFTQYTLTAFLKPNVINLNKMFV